MGNSNLPGHDSGQLDAASAASKETIRTLIERELRTVEKVSTQSPDARRHIPTIVNDFKQRAQAVFAAQVPQTLGAVMQIDNEIRASRQARTIQPGTALRPKRGSPVEALMKVAKSIRAGRLPFVPTETRKSAQQLINAVVGRTRGRKMATLNKETSKLIERHNLVPMAVHSAMPAGGEHTHSSERLETILREITQPANSSRRSGAVPISEHHAQRLEASLPRFNNEGGVYGGAAIVDAGESMENVGGVSAIYREGSSHVQSPEAPPRRTEAPAPRRRVPATSEAPAATAPQAEAHRAPAAGDAEKSQTHGGLGTGRGGGTVGASGGPVVLEGTLKIDGLRDWVATVQGKLNNV